MKLNVGQVVYVFYREGGKLSPGLITEEIIRKTVSGNSTSYLVQIGQADPVEVSSLKAEVFGSASEAKEKLMERFATLVKKLTDEAQGKAQKLYPKATVVPAASIDREEATLLQAHVDDDDDGDSQIVVDDDGNKVRIRIKS